MDLSSGGNIVTFFKYAFYLLLKNIVEPASDQYCSLRQWNIVALLKY
jgi:hypothetical protein